MTDRAWRGLLMGSKRNETRAETRRRGKKLKMEDVYDATRQIKKV